jgi:Cdc6-like AAA superfamily ATPase
MVYKYRPKPDTGVTLFGLGRRGSGFGALVAIICLAHKDVELAKSNIFLIGPTGSGKTLLAQTLEAEKRQLQAHTGIQATVRKIWASPIDSATCTCFHLMFV